MENVKSITYPIGMNIAIIKNSGNKKKGSLFRGKVIEMYDKHFLVQGENYRESVLKADVYTGEITIREEKGGLINVS